MAYLWKNLKCSLTARECQISTPSLAFARCKWTCSLTARKCQINTPSLVFARCKWTLKIFSQVFTYNARMLYYKMPLGLLKCIYGRLFLVWKKAFFNNAVAFCFFKRGGFFLYYDNSLAWKLTLRWPMLHWILCMH